MSGTKGRDGGGASLVVARWTRWVLTALVSTVMFSMMVLTTADVVGRALFDTPIKGSAEIISFMLAIVVFGSLPLVTWDEQHITVNLFERWIGRSVQRALAFLLSAVSTAVVAAIAYRMWTQASLMAEGQHITGALEWPIAPIAYFMSVLSGFTALILLVITWRKMIGAEPLPSRELDPYADRAGAE